MLLGGLWEVVLSNSSIRQLVHSPVRQVDVRGDEEQAWYDGSSVTSDSHCVSVHGNDFGTSNSDLVRLESCIVVATETFTGQDVDQEIEALNKQFQMFKQVVQRINQDASTCREPDLSSHLREEAAIISHKISDLLRQLDEREWDDISEERDGEGESDWRRDSPLER